MQKFVGVNSLLLGVHADCAERGEAIEKCSSSIAANGLHHFQYNHSQVARTVKRHLEETDFTGVTVAKILTEYSVSCQH